MKKFDIINPISGTKSPFTISTLFGYVVGAIALMATFSLAQKVGSKVESVTGGRVDTSPMNPFNQPVTVASVKTDLL